MSVILVSYNPRSTNVRVLEYKIRLHVLVRREVSTV